MLHALSFSRATPAAVSVGSGGVWTLSYKNRFVESKTFQLERSRNHPAFLPLIEGDAPAVLASFLLNKLRFGKMAKDLSNTNVFEFSGKVFAVAENHMPLEIDLLSLETIGDWDLSGAWDRPFMAHPKKAPGGELVFVGADGKKPFLVLGVVSVDGKELKHKVDLKLERGIVCHDIGVTERYNIILDMPLTFDLVRLMKGGPLLKYEKESYARIGVMPRYGDSDSIKWFEVEPYCTLHLVNCYEDGDEENDNGGYVKVERHPLGANEFCSGAAFVSKQGGVQEDDGWMISFVHNEHTNTSQVHIIDAKNFEDDPVAKIILPKRVPYGFHGAFIPMPNRL